MNNSATFADVRTIRDDKGHEIATETTNISFPHGYGVITGDSGSVAAGGTYATMKFEGTDEWIQTEATTESNLKKVKFTHEFNRGTDTTETVNLSTNNSASFNDVKTLRDATGHEVATHTTTIQFPHGYGTVIGDSGSVAAGGTYATVKFEGTDNWIQTEATTEDNVKKIKFTHEYTAGTDTTATANLSTNNSATFVDILPTVDSKGHVTAQKSTTITFPHGYGVVQGDTGTNLAAGGSYATIKFTGADDWTATETVIDNNIRTVKITHTGPITTNTTALGETGNKTPAFGETFKVPSFSIDNKGHIAVSADHTVMIPHPSVYPTNQQASSSNVLNSLTYANGTFTTTSTAANSLVLTGYSTPSGVTANIAGTDTIGQAFGKLESQIAALDTAAVTASTGEVISSVSQADGKVSVSKKTLAAGDIPTLTANKISDFASYQVNYTKADETSDSISISELATLVDDLIARVTVLEA